MTVHSLTDAKSQAKALRAALAARDPADQNREGRLAVPQSTRRRQKAAQRELRCRLRGLAYGTARSDHRTVRRTIRTARRYRLAAGEQAKHDQENRPVDTRHIDLATCPSSPSQTTASAANVQCTSGISCAAAILRNQIHRRLRLF